MVQFGLAARTGSEHARMMISNLKSVVAAAVAASIFVPLQAYGNFAQAAKDTKLDFNVRYRLETVDQEGIEDNARASTAKARLSWIMPSTDGFSVGLEADHVFAVGEERHNSLSNGLVQFPIVADPTGFDLNQAFLRYRDDSLIVTMGRQRILHGTQRLVGGVAWRQNEQTFDALRVQSVHDNASADYSYVTKVNRIFGPDGGVQPAQWEGGSHLFRLEVKPVEGHAFGTFVYLMDFENDNGPANANRTFGVDYSGSYGDFRLYASFAQQSDWADNPVAYDAAYYTIEASTQRGPVTYTAGYEVLGSDEGAAGFRAPAATLHKFQGWTDRFLGTPPTGVRDLYLKAAAKAGPANLGIAFHDFTAAEGGADYGREVDMSISCPLGEKLGLLFKFARYNAREHATDITKGWFVITYSL